MSIGSDIDYLYKITQERLAVEKTVEEMKKREKAMSDSIIAQLGVDTTGAKGTKAQFSISKVIVPQVKDWNQVYNFIRETNSFFLLHKRLGVGEWSAYREDGILVPGTEAFEITKPTLRKIK